MGSVRVPYGSMGFIWAPCGHVGRECSASDCLSVILKLMALKLVISLSEIVKLCKLFLMNHKPIAFSPNALLDSTLHHAIPNLKRMLKFAVQSNLL